MTHSDGTLFADDDGRVRTGTVWSATAHAVTAIIGSGVLAIPWSVAQLGWVLAPVALIFFSFVTYYTATLLADCYRHPGPVEGRRNYTYTDAARAFLGHRGVLMLGIVQYIIIYGALVGYTITAVMSMIQIEVTGCHHARGKDAPCQAPWMLFLMIFGGTQIVLSQLPSLENVSILSYAAAMMSFAYSFIGLYLCTNVFVSHHEIRGSVFPVTGSGDGLTSSVSIWHNFQALGNIAFAYTFAMLLIEIQDTLKAPPSENKTMKRASIYGIGATTLFYLSLGFVGYGAFGAAAPGNVLVGFYEPFWLIEIGNIAVLVHMIGGYQVFSQPAFALCENWCGARWPNSGFFHSVHKLPLPFAGGKSFEFTLSRLVVRTILVCLSTLVSAAFPFFNAVLGLLGSIAFWPLTVHYPVCMHLAQAPIKRGSLKWVALMAMSSISLLVSLVGAAGSIMDIAKQLKHARPFHFQ